MFVTSKDLCPRTEGEVILGVSNFFASSKTQDKVGQDGLPLTPSTTEIFGRFQFLTVRMSTRVLIGVPIDPIANLNADPEASEYLRVHRDREGKAW